MRRCKFLVEHYDPVLGLVPAGIVDTFQQAFDITPEGVKAELTVLWEPVPAGVNNDKKD